jgi:hypothetical protein
VYFRFLSKHLHKAVPRDSKLSHGGSGRKTPNNGDGVFASKDIFGRDVRTPHLDLRIEEGRESERKKMNGHITILGISI